MSEWWTYRPADLLMFSPETYYRLFELHNQTLWPAQIGALAAGLAILALRFGQARWHGRAIAGLLAAVWLFVAWGYFFERYAAINLAAGIMGWAFVLQAALLAASAAAGMLSFSRMATWHARAGMALLVFSLFLQPLIGPLAGRSWAGVELFGMAPDPTVLATLGVLVVADRVRFVLLLIPLLWCVITGVTLWTMGAPDALLMPAAGLLTLALGLYGSLEARTAHQPKS